MTMDVNCVPMEEGRKTGTLRQTPLMVRLTSQKSVYQHGGGEFLGPIARGELLLYRWEFRLNLKIFAPQ